MKAPYENYEKLRKYHEMYYRLADEVGINGTFPWWWPGGYRFAEYSDFGIVDPDGVVRSAGELITQYSKSLKKPRSRRQPDVWHTIDREANAGGYWHLSFHEGKDAYAKAKKEGKWVGFKTEGTGTTSIDAPLTAVGNVPCTGANPPKFLNAEFNYIEIQNIDGEYVKVNPGGAVKVKATSPVMANISVGNMQEAEWIAPSNAGGRQGGVYVASAPFSGITVDVPIAENVPYHDDARMHKVALCPAPRAPALVALRMEAKGRAAFGEIFIFTIEV
jgi:hypothetical protein